MVTYDAILAETIQFEGHDGDQIPAYLARRLDTGPAGGVVVLHHMPGYDEETREIAIKFALHGYNAICPHLHFRDGPDSSPDDAAAASRASGGVPDERIVGDVAGALRVLKGLSNANGKVGTIGYCSGGRQSFLCACRLELDAAVDCYGAFVVKTPPSELQFSFGPLIDEVANLSCPLLGMFGEDDANPNPDETAQMEEALKKHGKEYEIHTYPGAGHSFFWVTRPSYRPEAAVDGWEKVFDFFARTLSTPDSLTHDRQR